MTNNARKIPVYASIGQAARRKAADAIALTGKAYPASVTAIRGSIVTVNFELQTHITLPKVTIPLFGPEYVRYPIQAGCKGIVISADAYIGGMSGLGGGTAGLGLQANLTNLVFLPISNQAWSAVDPNAITIYGPNGVVLRDETSDTILTLTPDGIVMNAASVSTTGNLVAGLGATGTLTDATGRIVTVRDGIITNIY